MNINQNAEKLSGQSPHLTEGESQKRLAGGQPDLAPDWSESLPPGVETVDRAEALDVKIHPGVFGKGCLAWLMFVFAGGLLGFVVFGFFFSGGEVDALTSEGVGVLILAVTAGFIFGERAFFQRTAPHVYVRGLWGLPDFKTMNVDPETRRPAREFTKIVVGISAGLTVWLVTLALTMAFSPVGTGAEIAVFLLGLVTGPAAGVVVFRRTCVADPIPEE
jgi:hypothetical protein